MLHRRLARTPTHAQLHACHVVDLRVATTSATRAVRVLRACLCAVASATVIPVGKYKFKQKESSVGRCS